MESKIITLLRAASEVDLSYFSKSTATKDISVDIFKESMHEYVEKLKKATKGNYDLDNYDMQVISIALGQFSEFHKIISPGCHL